MKFIKKVLAILISIIIVSSSSVMLLFSVSAASDNTERDIVLIVDTSSSMDGEPMSAAIEAATKFCETILTGTTNTDIALVTLNTSSTIISGFTRDISNLTNSIKSFNGYGTTNIGDALATADSLLNASTRKSAQKSIVLMTDGIPTEGSTYDAVDARYPYVVYGDGYDYSSAVYNFAKSLTPRNYNIYTLGFFHSLTGQTLKLGQALLKDIQNKGYYEVTDIDKLLAEFIKIAQDIIQPLTVTVSHTQKSAVRDIKDINSTLTTYVITYVYEIEAKITNDNDVEINNATATIKLSNGMQLDSGNSAQSIGKIAAKGTTTVTWTIKIPDVIKDKNLDYSVAVESDKTLTVSAYGKIFAKGTSGDSNLIIFGKDNWQFENWNPVPMPITDIDLKALKLSFSETDRQCIDDAVKSGIGGGLCYGMSVSTILAKVGRLSPADLQTDAKSLYEVEKKNGQSTISYYHITQIFPEFQNHVTEFLKKSMKERLSTIKDLADKVDNGGNPFVICYEYKGGGGHAVVGYGYERGDFKKKGHKYNSRILIYDVNSPKWDENLCLYFNEGTDEWTIPAKNLSDIYSAFSDINQMDAQNLSSNTKTVYSYLRAKDTTDLIVKSGTGSIYNINQTNISGAPGAVAYYDTGGTDAALNVLLPEESNQKEEKFSVAPQTAGAAVDLSLRYNNYYMSASAPGTKAVNFDPKGAVGLTGEVSNFNIALTGNKGHLNLPWYTIKVSGEGAGNPELKKVDEGCILNAKNMKNITVTGKNDDETKEAALNTDEESVLIGNLNGELAIYTDKNGDGKYETLIATSNRTIEPETSSVPTPPDKNDSFPNWAIALLVIAFVILIGGAIIIFVILGSKGSKNETMDIPVVQSSMKEPVAEEKVMPISNLKMNSAAISILSGSMKGTTIPIKADETLNLGKDPKISNVVFSNDYERVSRLHCTITYSVSNNKYFVVDCSHNGTYTGEKTRLEKGKRTPMNHNTILLLADDGCSILLK